MRFSLIAFLCLTVGSSTFSIGAFPALLPDLDQVAGLSTIEIGAVSAAFGFARMLVDVPAGLFVARHIRWALLGAPVLLSGGIVALVSGGPLPVLLLGRVLMGIAHAVGMVAWLTTIMRYQGRAVGASLNAFELSAILGMLGGVAVIGALPRTLPWNLALGLACLPQLLGIVLAPFVLASLPRQGTKPPAPPAGGAVVGAPAAAASAERQRLVVLAFVAGTALALTYSTIELFVLPLRGSREFGLDRIGVARLLMIAQLCDIAALLPVGVLADRLGPNRLLGAVLLSFASAAVLMSMGGLGAMTMGTVFLGLGMAGWMLPLAVLRRATPPARIPWRTALYRVGVDGGLFMGPLVAGILGDRTWMLTIALAGVLAFLAVTLLANRDLDALD